MVYRPTVDRHFCFVLMPFGQPFDGYFNLVLTPAIEAAGFRVLRADQIYGTRRVMRDIWQEIWRAGVVIADVSGANPNVNYELGLCHALCVPTIIITKQINDVPFDYRDRRCIVYDTNQAHWEKQLTQKLQKTLAALTESGSDDDLPWPYDTAALTQLATATLTISVENPRERMVRGIAALDRLIARAYGPTGENVSVRVDLDIVAHKSGLAIARGLRSANPIEEGAIDQMRLAALQMDQQIGDGAKTTILIAYGILKAAESVMARGIEPAKLANEMELPVAAAIASLKAQAQAAASDELFRIAYTSSADMKIATAVVEGMHRAGRHGVLTIAQSNSPDPFLEVLEGFRFDQGYLSESFITDADTKECVLEKCRILLCQQRLSSMKDLLPLLEQVARAGEPLVVVAGDVEGEALATLVTNRLRGTLAVVAVKVGAGLRAGQFLFDLAILTGGVVITQEAGINITAARLSDLGIAEKVVINRTSTTITGGGGEKRVVAAHVSALGAEINRTANELERRFLQERVANLAGSVVTIRIGGRSPAEAEDQRYRTASAIGAARAAIEEGYGYGGGAALLNAALAVSRLPTKSESERAAADVISSALESPFRTLVEWAGLDPTLLIRQRLESSITSVGFDPQRKTLRDLVADGALDPIQLLRTSLEVAFSHARMILKTGAWSHTE